MNLQVIQQFTAIIAVPQISRVQNMEVLVLRQVINLLRCTKTDRHQFL